MTDSKLIRDVIRDRGLKIKYIAKEMGLSPYGLQKKMDNISEFKVSEVEAFCSAVGGLDIQARQRIFFADEVDLKSTNRERGRKETL
ncbi:MAG: hypothetical protein IJ955_06840 [Oscillospiraceae bacterium]|nr:hypothetical protein [Oscillospiraceae bacterium]